MADSVLKETSRSKGSEDARRRQRQDGRKKQRLKTPVHVGTAQKAQGVGKTTRKGNVAGTGKRKRQQAHSPLVAGRQQKNSGKHFIQHTHAKGTTHAPAGRNAVGVDMKKKHSRKQGQQGGRGGAGPTAGLVWGGRRERHATRDAPPLTRRHKRFRSTCGGRWPGLTRRTRPWRSTWPGTSTGTTGWSRQSTRSTCARAGRRP